MFELGLFRKIWLKLFKPSMRKSFPALLKSLECASTSNETWSPSMAIRALNRDRGNAMTGAEVRCIIWVRLSSPTTCYGVYSLMFKAQAGFATHDPANGATLPRSPNICT